MQWKGEIYERKIEKQEKYQKPTMSSSLQVQKEMPLFVRNPREET